MYTNQKAQFDNGTDLTFNIYDVFITVLKDGYVILRADRES